MGPWLLGIGKLYTGHRQECGVDIFVPGSLEQVHTAMPETILTLCSPLPEGSDSSWGVEDDLSSIHTVHEPVERVMAPVADIHSYLPKLCLEHCVASVALHIICRLSVENVRVRKRSEHGSLPNSAHVPWIQWFEGDRPLTSLKSPIRGIWFFLLFPSTFPELEITTAVFHRVSCSSSRSRIGETTTMLYFLAS